MAATAISTMQSMPLSGFGNGGALSSFTAADDPFSSSKTSSVEAAPQNFQLYRHVMFSYSSFIDDS